MTSRLTTRCISAAGACVTALVAGSPALSQTTTAQNEVGSAVAPLIVTARKRPEAVLETPQSISVFGGEALDAWNMTSVVDLATKVPNLSFAYGNGATAIGDARTIAIRGVSGPNTTAIYIDQTPVPGSIDPRLVDLERVEVLRGPQGTLYGESSLGGNVRFISRSPSFDRSELSLGGEAGVTRDGGRPDLGFQVTGNSPFGDGRFAVRGIGFYDQTAGYLSRSFPDPAAAGRQKVVDDQGAQRSYGVSLSAKGRLTPQLDVMVRLIAQQQDDHGFPATFAPLPGFRPQPNLQRAFDIQPRVSDGWALPSMEVTYRGEGWRLESSTSYFERRIREREDSTVGTAQFLALIGAPLLDQPYVWNGVRKRRQWSHESRVAFGEGRDFSGVVGLFHAEGHDTFLIPPIFGRGLQASGAWPYDLLWTSDIRLSQTDTALFGELYYSPQPRLHLTLGLRQYWLAQSYHLRADGFLDGGLTDDLPGKNREKGLSPKIAVAYDLTAKSQVYASASKGFRAGGSGQAVIPQCEPSLTAIGLTSEAARRYGSDTVWSYEIGAKAQLRDAGVQVTAAAFHLDWRNIQQSVFLPSCAFIITANAGAAVTDGGELELSGQLSPHLGFRAGVGYQDAHITQPGASGQAAGARVYQTARWTWSAAGLYRRPITGSLDGLASLDISYVGDSVSNNSGGGLTLVRRPYALINARVGVSWGRSELTLNVRNLTNERPNLGDIGYLGYAQRDSLSPDLPNPQVVTIPPTTASIQYRVRLGR